jgi:anaerobic ribonucleoside-triphosphate reductase activating protein
MQIRVSGIENESIVDGPGIRMVIFAQGCKRGCPGCHNPETHPLDGGYEVDASAILASAVGNPLLRGLTFSGGEPFLQARAFAFLASAAHEAGLDIFTYTGYTIEEILEHDEHSCDGFRALLSQTDILVDGPYIADMRTFDAPFRGSANQRVIDVAATLERLRPEAADNANNA